MLFAAHRRLFVTACAGELPGRWDLLDFSGETRPRPRKRRRPLRTLYERRSPLFSKAQSSAHFFICSDREEDLPSTKAYSITEDEFVFRAIAVRKFDIDQPPEDPNMLYVGWASALPSASPFFSTRPPGVVLRDVRTESYADVCAATSFPQPSSQAVRARPCCGLCG